MMFGQFFRKINLMNLVTIFTELTALVLQEYLGPATMSQVCYFVSRMLWKLLELQPSKTIVLCTWNIPKGQRVDTTVKPVRDLVFEKSVYTKRKNLNQLN